MYHLEVKIKILLGINLQEDQGHVVADLGLEVVGQDQGQEAEGQDPGPEVVD